MICTICHTVFIEIKTELHSLHVREHTGWKSNNMQNITFYWNTGFKAIVNSIGGFE